jgi:CheY-like chemotaxis protein
MDLFMPNMDGLQATREIRKWEQDHDHKPIPIISLTANVMPGIHSLLFFVFPCFVLFCFVFVLLFVFDYGRHST